ncbi:MAG TPA: hypothetical protein K8V44_04575 [Staphylococcus saprophyticus]|nr:hypothetical protein [Staphylococcus saprophyticus]
MRGNYKYSIGEEVNGLIIVAQTYTQDTKRKYRAYEVQSVSYPDAPTYITLQDNLSRGVGDAYASGRRVFEGNSLWSKKEYRKYILDIEKAKTIPPYSSVKIEVKCDNCDKIKMTSPNKLLNYGVQCVNCSNGLSFPERMFTAYLETKNIEYDYQVRFDDLEGRIFDYQIQIKGITYLVETHGEQHYLTKNKKFFVVEDIQKSDQDKRQYAKDNNIEYIELDCRESDIKFIKKSIEQCKYLPNITSNDERNIVSFMENSAQYDVKKMVQLYEQDKMSTLEIAELFKITHNRVNSMLRKNGVSIRGSGKHQNFDELTIVEEYVNGMSLTNLGKSYNTTHQTIARILRQNGVAIRSSGEQRKINKNNN